MEIGDVKIEEHKGMSRKQFLIVAGGLFVAIPMIKIRSIANPLGFLKKTKANNTTGYQCPQCPGYHHA